MLVALVLGIELAVCGWQRASIRRIIAAGPSARKDLAWFVITMTGIGALALYPVSKAVAYLHSFWTPTVFSPSAWAGFPNLLLDYIVFLVVMDFIEFAIHTTVHKVPAFWTFHKVHHSAEEFTVINSARFHTIDVAVAVVIVGVLVLLVGRSPAEVAALWGARTFIGYLVHSNINTEFGWLGRWIFVSPNAHRVHHSSAPEHHDSNYGTIFIVWDRLFGTYRRADPSTYLIGLADAEDRAKHNGGSFVDHFLQPFRESLARLGAGLRRR